MKNPSYINQDSNMGRKGIKVNKLESEEKHLLFLFSCGKEDERIIRIIKVIILSSDGATVQDISDKKL